MDHLNYQTNQRTAEMTAVAAQFAGQMALRLVHDHVLNLDVSRYSSVLYKAVVRVYRRINQLLRVSLTVTLTLFLLICSWIYSYHLDMCLSAMGQNNIVLRNFPILMCTFFFFLL